MIECLFGSVNCSGGGVCTDVVIILRVSGRKHLADGNGRCEARYVRPPTERAPFFYSRRLWMYIDMGVFRGGGHRHKINT